MPDGITRIGAVGVHEVGRRRRFDPARGIEEVITYEGEEAGINTEAAWLRSLGLIAEAYPYEGPTYRMDVVGSLSDQNSDFYERVTEFVQEDLRENPKVIASFVDDVSLALTYAACKRAITAGQSLIDEGSIAAPSAAQLTLYTEMARGVTSHEISRIILRRRRRLPAGYQTPTRTPSALEPIYSTARLVQVFQIPPVIQAIYLPATPPTAPSLRQWGWKLRNDVSRLEEYTTFTEEVMEWTFAAWSTTLLYDYLD